MKQETQNQIDAMAATLRPQITIAAGAGNIAADAYVKTLPEGITIETVQKLQDHNAVFFPAVTKALGEESIEAMKKDSTIESVSLSVPWWVKTSSTFLSKNGINTWIPRQKK